MNIRELPEPYYGDGAKCKGVLVHLNPGASDPNELSKIYGRGGFLIGKFETDCEKKYSTFAARYSSLLDSYPEGKDPHSVPGHDWWHQDGRFGWIKRFYGDNVSMADIFVLEACPYHSASWKGRMGNVEEHIAQRVIAPAVAAASHLEKPCAVFVGSGYNSIIQKIKGMSRILFKRGTRVYSLYKYDPSEDQCAKGVAYLLVVNGCQGMYLPANNPLNAEIEKKIDELIRTR